MADRTQPQNPNFPAPGRFEPGGHLPSWTDGFPHDFKGWGPQTPDIDQPDHIQFRQPESDLIWRGEEERDHIVWRFEPRRH